MKIKKRIFSLALAGALTLGLLPAFSSPALDAGDYPATLHYDCYTIEDNQPLNGAEIQLTLEVK